MLSVIGYGTLILFFAGILRANARRWRYLAKSYSGAATPLETRNWQSVVLAGQGAFNSLNGIVQIGVTSNGVTFRVMPPFSLFHSPLHIPFDELHGGKTSWYLNAASIEFKFRGSPEITMIMPAEQAEWIQNVSQRRIVSINHDLQNSNGVRGWQIFSLFQAGISVAIVGWLSILLLSQ